MTQSHRDHETCPYAIKICDVLLSGPLPAIIQRFKVRHYCPTYPLKLLGGFLQLYVRTGKRQCSQIKRNWRIQLRVIGYLLVHELTKLLVLWTVGKEQRGSERWGVKENTVRPFGCKSTLKHSTYTKISGCSTRKCTVQGTRRPSGDALGNYFVGICLATPCVTHNDPSVKRSFYSLCNAKLAQKLGHGSKEVCTVVKSL